MPESWRSRRLRWYFNVFPAYWGSGGKVMYISSDFLEIRVKLPLTWRTRNYVGTLFGGSIYSVVDPIYMIMLIQNLGPGYVVWDKAARILFKKPGRSTLYATFKLAQAEIDRIKNTLEAQPTMECLYEVELLDQAGVLHACVEKTIHIRKK